MSTELKITINDKNINIDSVTFQKMMFLYNSINDGWTIKKKNDSYIFIKNHEGKREVFQDSYLMKFMQDNMDPKRILS